MKPAGEIQWVEEPLQAVLERAVRDVIADANTKPADKLKAIEIGAKLLSIRHKIEGGGDGGNFFSGT
jgi:hypothetical protein